MLALPKTQLCLNGERYLFVEWLHIVERDQLRLKSRVEDSEVDSFFNYNQNYNNHKKILVISTFFNRNKSPWTDSNSLHYNAKSTYRGGVGESTIGV